MTLGSRLVVALVVVVLAIGITATIVVADQRSYLVDQVDHQLRAAAAPVAQAPGFGPSLPPPQTPRRDVLSELWIGVLSPDGRQLTRLNAFNLTSSAVPELTAGEAAAAARVHAPIPFTVGGSNGHDMRVLTVRGADGGVIVLALSLAPADQASGRLLTTLGIGAVATVLVTGLLGWWVWRLGLRPIRRMTATADAIKRGDIASRVESLPAGTEAGRLASALNSMLDQRQGAEDTLRRFVADASHELRTPLTSIRGYVDLYQRGGLVEEGALADAMRRISQESERMSGLVDDLLLLARLDEGRPLDHDAVDMGAILRDAANDANAVDPDRHVTVQLTGALLVEGDDHRLHQVIGAVITNALVHTAAPITLRGTAGPRGSVVVEVIDSGPGMSPNVAAHAFERFARGDGDGSGHQGAGLGLAVAKAIVSAHDGEIELQTHPGRGTSVRIRLGSVTDMMKATAEPSSTLPARTGKPTATMCNDMSVRDEAPAAPPLQ
jgi:two-component system OmpR family sensor kinase